MSEDMIKLFSLTFSLRSGTDEVFLVTWKCSKSFHGLTTVFPFFWLSRISIVRKGVLTLNLFSFCSQDQGVPMRPRTSCLWNQCKRWPKTVPEFPELSVHREVLLLTMPQIAVFLFLYCKGIWATLKFKVNICPVAEFVWRKNTTNRKTGRDFLSLQF